MNAKNNNAIFIAMTSLLIIVVTIGLGKDKESQLPFHERTYTTPDKPEPLDGKNMLLGMIPERELTEDDILANEALHIASVTPKLSKSEMHSYLKQARINVIELRKTNVQGTLPDCSVYSFANNNLVLNSLSTNGIDVQLHEEACRIYKNRFDDSIIAHIAKNADTIREGLHNVTL